MADAQRIIDTAFNRAESLVAVAKSIAVGLSWAGMTGSDTPVTLPQPPVFTPPVAFAGTKPTEPKLVTMPTLPSPGSAPTVPPISLPGAPAAVSIAMPPTTPPAMPRVSFGSAPSAPALSGSGISPPAMPGLTNPPEPTLTGTTIPDPPTITIPTFSGMVPTEDFIVLTIQDIASYWHFTDDLGRVWDAPTLTVVENKLLEDIRTGGTGIDPAVQDAIFSKAVERDLLAANEALQMAAEAFGKKGFPVPPDRLRAQQADIADKYAYTKAEKSRDIMVTTSELAQKNTQFAITGLTEVERLHLQAV